MILYEGEELVVHQAEGDTDYLLVTFVGAWETEHACRTFLAETPVRKNRISCLGITAKVDYWYISPETDHVLSLIRNIAAGYSRIILFGMSMGGHAAIAFSRALNADVVFTGAPKWSLDPEECEICEMGWLPSSPHGIAMCQNGRWKKRLRERTADEGYSD
ncbi:hypothetical protein GOB93_11345, partial [Acetobacter musti]|nr:hypothetical protein [Acetobacter musti]